MQRHWGRQSVKIMQKTQNKRPSQMEFRGQQKMEDLFCPSFSVTHLHQETVNWVLKSLLKIQN